jgi:hypothetical protein
MDTLAFLAKMIGATARVGAAVALGALLVSILRWMNVEPLASIDKSTYGAIVASGIIGACTVVVELMIAIGGVVQQVISQVAAPLVVAKIQRRRNRKAALKNLQTPRPEVCSNIALFESEQSESFFSSCPVA